MVEFLDDYGLDDLARSASEIMRRSESALSAAIEALPDGTTCTRPTADGYFEPFTLKVKIEIRGTDIYFDFAGSSMQNRNAAINAASI